MNKSKTSRTAIQKSAPKPLSSVPGLTAAIEAFDLVPEEDRADLGRYFNTPLGKHALGAFLDRMSAWWSEIGQSCPPAARRSVGGRWRDDPHWDDLMRRIADEQEGSDPEQTT